MPKMKKNTAQIAVLGGGVIGLTTGISLLETGRCNVTVYTHRVADSNPHSLPLVSEVACALWLPMWTNHSGQNRPGYQKQESHWSRNSFLRFSALGSSCGIDRVLHHEFYTEDDLKSGLFISAESADFLPDFHEGRDMEPPPMPHGMQPLVYHQTFFTYIIVVPIYLAWLHQRFFALGGKLIPNVFFETTEDVMRIKADLYVNALGLGASHVFHDAELAGIKGQVILCPSDSNVQCSVGAGEFCMIPRRDALVLGSLFQSRFDGIAPTEDNTNQILQVVAPWVNFPAFRSTKQSLSSHAFTPHKANIRALAGLRPFRSTGIRMALEQIGGHNIIHNYGHGGAGFSLSWGCAETVVTLFNTL